jgi:riboflavin synthase alpha subunit
LTLPGIVFVVPCAEIALDHTNLRSIHVDDPVNLEFDMLGKYVARVLQLAGPAVQEVK